MLLVEQDGDDPLEVRGRLHRLVGELWQQKRLAFGAREAFEDEETELFWRLVDRVKPALYRLPGPSRPVPLVEDIAVAPESLTEFLVRMQNVLKRNQADRLALLPRRPGPTPRSAVPRPRPTRTTCGGCGGWPTSCTRRCSPLQGSIGGEHACGLSRTALRPPTGRPAVSTCSSKIKRIFDPANLLNPGKIVGDDPDLITRHLRPADSGR